MPDHIGAERFQRRADGARLIGRTLCLRKRKQIIGIECAA
jgi:hypothetical protein